MFHFLVRFGDPAVLLLLFASDQNTFRYIKERRQDITRENLGKIKAILCEIDGGNGFW